MKYKHKREKKNYPKVITAKEPIQEKHCEGIQPMRQKCGGGFRVVKKKIGSA